MVKKPIFSLFLVTVLLCNTLMNFTVSAESLKKTEYSYFEMHYQLPSFWREKKADNGVYYYENDNAFIFITTADVTLQTDMQKKAAYEQLAERNFGPKNNLTFSTISGQLSGDVSGKLLSGASVHVGYVYYNNLVYLFFYGNNQITQKEIDLVFDNFIKTIRFGNNTVNNYAMDTELAIILAVGFTGIALLFGGVIALRRQTKKLKKQDKRLSVANVPVNEAIEYVDYGNSVSIHLKRRAPSIECVIKIKPVNYSLYTEHPDKLVYTGVTIGAVTVGDVKKVDGYTTGRIKSDGRCKFIYDSVNARCDISYVYLDSKEILEDAQNYPPIAKYLDGNKLMLKNKKVDLGFDSFSDVMRAAGGSMATSMNTVNYLNNIEYYDKLECEMILHWMEGK